MHLVADLRLARRQLSALCSARVNLDDGRKSPLSGLRFGFGDCLQRVGTKFRVPSASILLNSRHGVRLNDHLEHDCALTVFHHACKMSLEGIVSKRFGSRYRSGRSPDWLKFKNPLGPAVRRKAEEDWGR
jgi:hypothetical protein